jgi:hypothetical protein
MTSKVLACLVSYCISMQYFLARHDPTTTVPILSSNAACTCTVTFLDIRSPKITGGGSALSGGCRNSGTGSVAPPKGPKPKNAGEGSLPGCGWKSGAGYGRFAAAPSKEISCEMMRDERMTEQSRVCSGISGVKMKCNTDTTYNGHSHLLYSPDMLSLGQLMLLLGIFSTMP